MTVRYLCYWWGFTLAVLAVVGLLFKSIVVLFIGSDVATLLIPASYLLATGIIGIISWAYGAGIFKGRKKDLHMPLGK